MGHERGRLSLDRYRALRAYRSTFRRFKTRSCESNMEFGLYLTCYYGPGEIDETALYRDTLASARLAEDVGFDSISIPSITLRTI